jgi:hypothetical protein
LIDRFKNEFNPLLEEFQPARDNFDEWLAFEGAYEECLDRIRRHIMKTRDRDEKMLYGTRRHDDIDKVQEIQRNLRNLKEKSEQFATFTEDSTRGRTKMAKLRNELHGLFLMMMPDTRQRSFGEDSEETFTVSEDRRNEVINWVESQILTEAANELKGRAERLLAAKVHKVYRAATVQVLRRTANTYDRLRPRGSQRRRTANTYDRLRPGPRGTIWRDRGQIRDKIRKLRQAGAV